MGMHEKNHQRFYYRLQQSEEDVKVKRNKERLGTK